MLSQTVEYALRAIVCLANSHPHPQTNEQLAEITQVPSAYLPKVMQSLVKAGCVRSQRGPNGGLTLSMEPKNVSLLAVVNAVEPIPRIRECPLKIRSHGTRLCSLHRKLDEAAAMVEKTFGDTTLADILAESTGSIPLCRDQSKSLIQLP